MQKFISQTNFNIKERQDLLFPLLSLQYHSYLWLTGLVILLEGSDLEISEWERNSEAKFKLGNYNT